VVIGNFAGLAAPAMAGFELADDKNEKTLLGASAEVRKICSALVPAEFDDVGLTALSPICGAAASVRTPIFDAIIVGAIPFEATGVEAAADAGAITGVDAALRVCD
jgi:hypothetical protein